MILMILLIIIIMIMIIGPDGAALGVVAELRERVDVAVLRRLPAGRGDQLIIIIIIRYAII